MRVYRGLIPADDAPDIVANTFLAQLSDETLKKIRYGFLEHREREYLKIRFHIYWEELTTSTSEGNN